MREIRANKLRPKMFYCEGSWIFVLWDCQGGRVKKFEYENVYLTQTYLTIE